MDATNFKDNWTQIVPHICTEWDDLTEEELEEVGGNKEQLIKLIEEKYELTKEAVEDKLDELMEKVIIS